MPDIRVRDISLYYESAGQGDPALLFIHGMCGGAWTWADQAGRLSGRFTCVSYDRRGHSRSAPGTEDQSDRTHADDAVALIEALGLDRPVVVASSGGAVIAVDLLHRYPGAVRGAVLSEPPLFSIDPAAGKALLASIAPAIEEAVARGGRRAAVDAFFERVCGGLWSRLDESGKDRYRDNAPMLFASFERVATTVGPGDLAATRVPTLVVTGADSLPAFGSIARQLAQGLPNSRFLELQGSGHVTYAEQPAAFATAVTAFAGGLPAAAGPAPVGASVP